MNKMYMTVIGGLLAALLVVGIVGATSAFAQESHNGPMMEGLGRGGHGPHLEGEALDAVAQVLGMTPEEVSSALEDGSTLQDLAEQAGVDFEDVKDAIQAVHQAELRDRIEQALDEGTITQANADWLLEGIDNGFFGPGAFGFGHHGPGGPGEGGPRSENAPQS